MFTSAVSEQNSHTKPAWAHVQPPLCEVKLRLSLDDSTVVSDEKMATIILRCTLRETNGEKYVNIQDVRTLESFLELRRFLHGGPERLKSPPPNIKGICHATLLMRLWEAFCFSVRGYFRAKQNRWISVPQQWASTHIKVSRAGRSLVWEEQIKWWDSEQDLWISKAREGWCTKGCDENEIYSV